MNARPLVAALLLFGSAGARAQLTCSPTHLHAGDGIHVMSPGAFGGSPSADVVLTYRNTAGGTATRFGPPRSWSVGDVAFSLPAGIAVGTYEVVLASPAGALRNPSCFTVEPALTAITTIRGPAAGSIPTATLDIVVDGDWPCDGETKITLWGTRFTPGTEANGLDAASAWRAGKTMVEIGYEGAASAGMPPSSIAIARLVIRDATTMEFTVSRCLLMLPKFKVRVWFPDGTKSAWQYVRTAWDHPGSGSGVLTPR